MSDAIEQVLSTVASSDLFGDHTDLGDLAELRLRAATERLETQRQSIDLLDHRAREVHVEEIKSREDLVPLLFAHSIYKSYPESFVTAGRWDRLTLWLDTVSTESVRDTDMTGVADVDEWIDRLEERGVHIVITSGTTGKNSFFALNDADVTLIHDLVPQTFPYPRKLPANEWPVSFLGPSNVAMRLGHVFRAVCEAFARPGAAHSLTDERVRVTDMMAAVRVRSAMADGTAVPSDVAKFEASSKERTERLNGRMLSLVQTILGYGDEPQIVFGPWASAWRMLEIARATGIPDGVFHPKSFFLITGGLKGLALPDDYREQMANFLGSAHEHKAYGMTEISQGFPMCEAGQYHCAPFIELLIVDDAGERLLRPGPDGRVRGRVAFYDLGWEGRWGGIVTGDQATANFSARCSCGRPGPTIEDSVLRYSELSAGGDDKLTCGGAIEAYVRGIVDPA